MVYRVNPMTLTGFVQYLRDHGWPASLETAKGLIEAGVFYPAAIAFTRKGRGGEDVTDYAIIPSRLEQWFRENADEVRE